MRSNRFEASLARLLPLNIVVSETLSSDIAETTSSLVASLTAQAREVRETHISWVFLTDDNAFKVKKPVSLGFLDYDTAEKRRAACEAEVKLNERLSSGVYQGVVPITRGSDGRHRFGGKGAPVDWAVKMRRLPDRDRLDVRLREGRLSDEHLQELARRLAAFHKDARCDEHTTRFGSVEIIEQNVRENFAQTRESIDDFITSTEAAEIERRQLSFLRENKAFFQARIHAGRTRDGHGDLRLEQIYVDDAGTVQVLDCIEFNERFRYADVCADVAFLSMDLVYAGHTELAERFLALYARDGNDFDLFTLVDFYESYRAHVRGKVTAMLTQDAGADPSAIEQATKQARRYFLLALASQRRPLLPPVLIAVGGPLASGKSTVSDRLSAHIGAPVVSSDYTRKQMLGARPTDRLYESSWAGAYDPNFTEEVYQEVFRRAQVVLRSGRPVIVDASFRSRSLRARASSLAQKEGVPFRFVECRASLDVCRERLRVRDKSSNVSDGRLEIFDAFMSKWEPTTELSADVAAPIDTGGPIESNVHDVLQKVPVWP